jgi:glycine betaine/choline ABC-type transport system substrate-binding protein/ABC-type proline/glycine betaine transport system permease subunit
MKAFFFFVRHGMHLSTSRQGGGRFSLRLKRFFKVVLLTCAVTFVLPLGTTMLTPHVGLSGHAGLLLDPMRDAVAAEATVQHTGSRTGNRIVVGGKNFTEQLILSEMTSQYLSSLGYRTVLKNGLGSTLMRTAQINGELDVVWEYTGTSLILYNHVTDKLDEAQTYQRVKTLDAQRGLAWLNQSDIDNTYAVAVPRAKLGDMRTLSDLALRIRQNQADGQDKHGTGNQLAMDAEFGGRSDGLRPMLATYGITLPRRDIKQMDPGLVYTALKNGQVSAGVVYTTDGRVAGFDLALLADDRHYFAAYRATPVVRQATLNANPALAGQLNALAAKLDTQTMTALNKRVDIDQVSIASVAHDFLVENHLVANAVNASVTLATANARNAAPSSGASSPLAAASLSTLSSNASTPHKAPTSGLIGFLKSDWRNLLRLTLQHIELVALAVGAAILVGVPVGLAMSRVPWLASSMLAVGTVLLTLPSIALFGLMIPVFSRIGQGIGTLPAVVAVFLYSLLPIMRNTYLALKHVDPGIREAGTGIGMTLGQRLRYVELPLAIPGIMSGVRMAVVMNIGVMTIAAVIGAGGLGVLILHAISQSNMSKVAVGAVLVSVLAMVMDLLLARLQRALTPKGIQRT